MTETLMLTHVNIITLVSAIGHMTLAGICICFPRLPSLCFLQRFNNVSTIFPCSNSSKLFHWVFPTIITLTPSQGANVRILPASKYIYPNSIFQDWEITTGQVQGPTERTLRQISAKTWLIQRPS